MADVVRLSLGGKSPNARRGSPLTTPHCMHHIIHDLVGRSRPLLLLLLPIRACAGPAAAQCAAPGRLGAWGRSGIRTLRRHVAGRPRREAEGGCERRARGGACVGAGWVCLSLSLWSVLAMCAAGRGASCAQPPVTIEVALRRTGAGGTGQLLVTGPGAETMRSHCQTAFHWLQVGNGLLRQPVPVRPPRIPPSLPAPLA